MTTISLSLKQEMFQTVTMYCPNPSQHLVTMVAWKTNVLSKSFPTLTVSNNTKYDPFKLQKSAPEDTEWRALRNGNFARWFIQNETRKGPGESATWLRTWQPDWYILTYSSLYCHRFHCYNCTSLYVCTAAAGGSTSRRYVRWFVYFKLISLVQEM